MRGRNLLVVDLLDEDLDHLRPLARTTSNLFGN